MSFVVDWHGLMGPGYYLEVEVAYGVVADAKTLDHAHGPVAVLVAHDGTVFVDGQETALDLLDAAVRTSIRGRHRDHRFVVVRASARLPYAQVVQVIDHIAAVDGARIVVDTANPTFPLSRDQEPRVLQLEAPN